MGVEILRLRIDTVLRLGPLLEPDALESLWLNLILIVEGAENSVWSPALVPFTRALIKQEMVNQLRAKNLRARKAAPVS